MTLELYEPHMCCPTGVCGPSPDERMLRLNETLKSLKGRYPSLQIVRYMISRQPMQFRRNAAVFALLRKRGRGVLPVAIYNGEVVCTGRYPEREEIARYIERERGALL